MIVAEYAAFSEKLDIHDITFIPVSALNGDNIVTRSNAMPWYNGHTLLHILENVHVTADKNLVDFRFPVQYVIRPNQNFRGFAGTVASGSISVGEPVAILPSGKTSTVKSITTYDGEQSEAFAGQSVVISIEDERDVSRGEMIVRKNNLPLSNINIDAYLCWMDEAPMSRASHYILKHTTRTVKAFITKIEYKIDVNTLHRDKVSTFNLNEIGRVEIKTSLPLFFDPYNSNHETGAFILIDPVTNHTVAAGIIRGEPRTVEEITHTAKAEKTKQSSNITWEGGTIPLSKWELRNGHKAAVLWFTGYSGSGKSTVAKKLTELLFTEGHHVMMLDGDNVRHGLCGDLGFSAEDRTENIRRVGEAAKLFYEQGNIVVCTFISPFQKDRRIVRSILPEGRFIEVHVKCDLSVCKRRDAKGLYKKAEAGEIADFTGVTSPYEEPESPEVVVETDIMSVEDSVAAIKKYLTEKGIVE